MNALTQERKNIQSQPNLLVSKSCHRPSKCSFCGHYKLERGLIGRCQLLSAPVRGQWKSCALAMPAFAPSWEHVEGAKPSQGEFFIS
jgi:hypothetical protein